MSYGGENISKMQPKNMVFLAIAIIIMVSVMPSAIDTIYTVDTANWTIDGEADTKTTNIWWLLPLVVVAGIVLMAFGVFMVGDTSTLATKAIKNQYYKKK